MWIEHSNWSFVEYFSILIICVCDGWFNIVHDLEILHTLSRIWKKKYFSWKNLEIILYFAGDNPVYNTCIFKFLEESATVRPRLWVVVFIAIQPQKIVIFKYIFKVYFLCSRSVLRTCVYEYCLQISDGWFSHFEEVTNSIKTALLICRS